MRTHFSFGQKLLSYILVFALTITGILAKDTIKGATTVQAAETTTFSGEKVVEEALKYVGYNYSQTKRNTTGYFDCSSLVRKVLQDCGVTAINGEAIPSNTTNWINFFNGIFAGQTANEVNITITVNGQNYTRTAVRYTGSSEETLLESYAQNAKTGDIVITNGHAAITMVNLTNNKDYPDSKNVADLSASDLGKRINALGLKNSCAPFFGAMTTTQIQENTVLMDFANAYNFYKTYLSKVYGAKLQSQGLPAIATSTDVVNNYNQTLGTYPATIRPLANSGQRKIVSGVPVYNGLVYSMNEHLSGKYANLTSSVWRIEALNEDLGVAITNNIGGKMGETLSVMYVIQSKTYEGNINIQKIGTNGQPKEGARFGIYETPEAAIAGTFNQNGTTENGIVMDYTADPVHTFHAQWQQADGDTKTYYIKEIAAPDYYKLEESADGYPVVHKVVMNGEVAADPNATTDPNTITDYKIVNGQLVALSSLAGSYNAGTLTYTVEDESTLYGSISIIKKDNGGQEVKGATFKVNIGYQINPDHNAILTGPTSQTMTVDASGTVHTWNTPVWDYVVKPDGSDNKEVTYYFLEVEAPENCKIERGNDGKQVVYRAIIDGEHHTTTYEKFIDGAWEDLSYSANTEKATVTNVAFTTFTVKKVFDTSISSNVTSVTVNLLANGSAVVGTRSLTAADNWTYEWTNLPKYDEQGALITYSVVETQVNGVPLAQTGFSARINGGEITNYEPKTNASLVVGKILENRNFKESDTFTVTVTPLTANDPNQGKTITLNMQDLQNGKLQEVVALSYTYQNIGRPTTTSTKKYTYEIKETAGNIKGVTYDTTTYQVEVVVGFNAQDHTMNATYPNGNAVDFTNTYHANGSFVIEAKKQYENHNLAGGEFEFVLTNPSGTLFANTLTATNDAQGNVVFQAVDVTEANLGTHKLILKEKEGTKAYINYDKHEVAITVTITDNGDGTLTCTLTNADGTTYRPITDGLFENTYHAEGSFTIEAKKQYENHNLTGGEFTFVLTDVTEGTKHLFTDPITATNDAQGNVVFKTVNVTKAQEGTYKLTLKEVTGTKAYIDYDKHEVTITVKVEDNQTGTMVCTLLNAAGHTYNPITDGLFENTYHAKGEFKVEAYKEFKNQELVGGEFAFVLTDVTEGTKHLFTELTATNDKNGNVVFAAVNVTEADLGTYTLKLREVEGGKAYIDYDNHEVEITVEVKDNGDGTLSCILTNADGITYEPEKDGKFINTYNAKGSFVIKAYKEFKNQELVGGEFEFVLTDETGTLFSTLTAVNDKNGNVVFKTVNVTEADLGTHTLKLKEKAGTKAYIDYDNHEVEITVTISDNKDGTLSCTLTNADGITYEPTKDGKFTNTYNAEGSFTVKAYKEFKKGTLQGGEFTFVLTDETGTLFSTLTATNDANGNVVFATVDVTEANLGTYTLKLKEKAGTKAYIDYDKHEVTITVEIKDNGDGTLTCELTNAAGITYEPEKDGKFINTYHAEGSFTVKAYKEFKNQTLQGGEFSFVLTDETGTLFTELTAVNDKNGNVVFAAVNVTEAQLGTHTLKLKEKAGTKAYIDYDNHEVEMTVTISDNGDGTLTCELTNADGITYEPKEDGKFINTYNAKGSFVIKAFKEFKNQELQGGEFTFVLTDETGTLLSTLTATNDEHGNVTFAAVNVTEAQLGTHKLILKEKAGTKAYIDYDNHEVAITVEIKDNGNGTLSCTLTNADGITYEPTKDGKFINTYHAKGSFTVKAYKEFKNQTLVGGEFEFVLTDETGTLFTELTAVNDANGNVVFKTVDVTEANLGTHTLKLKEKAGTKAYIDYDNHEVEMTVTISDNGDGTLTCELTNAAGITYEPEKDGKFINTYHAEGSFVIEAFKKFKNQELVGGEFTFVLTDVTEGTDHLFTELTATNDKNGNVVFAAVNVTEANLGTYTLKLKEKAGTKAYIDYDKHEVTITVEITDNEDGTLTCTLSNSSTTEYAPKEDGIFTNTYHAKGSITLSVVKDFPYELVGGEFTFILADKDGNVLQEAANDAKGNVTFDALKFTEEDLGEKTVTIYEKEGEIAFISYDSTKIDILLTITDNKDGTLKVEATQDGNRYEPYHFINEITRFSLVIYKKDKDTQEYLSGASYNVFDKDGEIVASVTTNEEGKAEVEGLLKGYYKDGVYTDAAYTVVETKAPAGYALNPTPIAVTITEEMIISVTQENEKQKQAIGFIKRGQMVTGTKETETEVGTVQSLTTDLFDLKGVTFTIYKDEACENEVASILTGEGNYDKETGVTWSEPLALGTYYLKETNAPKGYVLDTAVYKVTLTGDETGTNTVYILDETSVFKNYLSGVEISLKKEGVVLNKDFVTYSENTLPLADVIFGIYTDQNILDPNGRVVVTKDTLIAIIKTNENGEGKLRYCLPDGDYYYKELRTLREFKLDTNAYKFTVDLTSNEVTKIDLNALREDGKILNFQTSGILQIEKHVLSYTGPYLAGAGFRIKNETTGEILNNPNTADGLWYTDKNGKTEALTVPIGIFNFEKMNWDYYQYSLYEEVIPEGYTIKEGDKTVYVTFIDALAPNKKIIVGADHIDGIVLVINDNVLGLDDYLPYTGLLMIVISLLMALRLRHKRTKRLVLEKPIKGKTTDYRL